MLGSVNFGGHEKHNSCVIHKHGGGYEIRLSLCPPLETALLVKSQADCAEDQASRAAECNSGQFVQKQVSCLDEWSLMQEVFDNLCARWHTLQVDLFATRYNHKFPKFVFPVPDPQAWKVDALSLHREKLDAYAFLPVSLGKVIIKILDQECRRLTPHCPGMAQHALVLGPHVSLSVQVPHSLPLVENLLIQPFRQCPHRNLPDLNLHAWLLETLAYICKGSLMR